MTKKELKEFIDLYKESDDIVQKLNDTFGIDLNSMGPSSKNNLYNNYNLLIHRLLTIIFGEVSADLIEEYCFGQWPELTFDDLCNRLKIEF